MFTRRTFLRGSFGATLAVAADPGVADAEPKPPIDRRALVGRHNVVRTATRLRSPLQVGNGQLAFGADVTGLQSFVPFNTLSQWGWHSAPLPAGETPADMGDEVWQARDRGVPYDSDDPTHPRITAWVFANPPRVNLGRIGLALLNADGTPAVEKDLADVRQELDLWTGTLHSRFTLGGAPVAVTTACRPEADAIAPCGSSRRWSRRAACRPSSPSQGRFDRQFPDPTRTSRRCGRSTISNTRP